MQTIAIIRNWCHKWRWSGTISQSIGRVAGGRLLNKISEPISGVPLSGLTAKQREVLSLIADNRTSKEIAGYLGVTESAVNQRLETIRTRLGGVPRAELARLYRQLSQMEFDEVTTCNSLTVDNIQLTDVPLTGNDEFGKQRVEAFRGDGWRTEAEMAAGPPLKTASEAKLVPDMLEGKNGSLNRIAVIVGIATGLLVIFLACLGVAQALSALV
jgi:DNA-binding CsgD family transcriptional regulator